MSLKFGASARLFVAWVLLSATYGAQQPANGPERARLEAIIRRVIPDDVRVCDAVSFRTSADAPPTVLASLDASGRNFCNGIVRVEEGEPPTLLQEIDAWEVEKLDDVVKDVDQDGHLELIVPRPFSPYEGADCIAVVPIVFSCSGTVCVDSSSHFADFYREQLSLSQERIVARSASADRRDGLPCAIVERDKVERLLGVVRAGFEQAEEWMRSPDPRLRRKAIYIFADIADDASRQRLGALATDSDPTVAKIADIWHQILK